jgi:hypothetical protein
MPTGKPNSVAWIVVVVLLSWYVGAYYMMVERYWSNRPPDYSTVALYNLFGTVRGASVNRFAVPIFTPIHWLDRRIRPQIWDTPPPVYSVE